ncbi:hypothetical protein [Cryobacterium sp.]|uniref:hypothetical protein n=1 Tax=Cryobacterium sp. TaxID=1926290 RepID=UPI00262BC1D7|nr:hypothetical protein [Cryobacterium sp.]MCU1445263.1 hypothetical protein [Cryobacterium sp.]
MTTTGHPRKTRPLFVTLVVVTDLIALAIAFWPMLILGLGFQAIGATNGWWPGDPNSNDGEAVFATLVGSVGLALVLIAAAIPVALVSRQQHQPVLRSTVRNTLYLLGACLVIGILTFFL